MNRSEVAAPVIDPPTHESNSAISEITAVAANPLLHPITVITVILLLVMGIMLTLRHTSDWVETYIPSAKLLIHGGDIYKDLPGNTYPPFSALLFVPFTIVPIHLARAVWFSVIAGSMVVLVRSSWKLAGGTRLEPLTIANPPDFWAYVVGHICVFQFALNAMTHLQTDLTIAALVTLGCAAIAQERYLRAALWIGAGAAFKVTPLLFAPYLLWRRQWGAAVLLVVVAIGLNLLPNMVPPKHGGTWLGQWYSLYVRPMTRSDYRPGNWKNLLNNNQALSGAAQRWVESSWKDDPDSMRSTDKPDWAPAWLLTRVARLHQDWTPRQVASAASAQVVRVVFLALVAIVLLPLTLCLWWRWRSGALPVVSADQRVLECAIVILLMLLLSPNSSRGHFCLLYLPAFCVARLAFKSNNRVMWILLALAAICSTLSIHIRMPSTHSVEQILMWLGMVMWASIALLMALCLAVAFASKLKNGETGQA